MTGCRSGASRLAPLPWLAAAAVALITVSAATASTSLPVSQPPSACRQQQQERQPRDSPLRPTDLWQFADASVSAVADSCHFAIDAPQKSRVVGGGSASAASVTRGSATTAPPIAAAATAASSAAAAAAVVTPGYSSPSNASAVLPAVLPAPQLLVVRLISWHPGSDCVRTTCSRNSSVPLRSDGGRCAVALSLAQPSSSSSFAAASPTVGAGDSWRSAEALLISGGGGGPDSSASSSASAAATIAWTDAALSARVSGSGCCGAQLLLGYKLAPAQSACRSAARASTAFSPPSTSPPLSSSSEAPPYSSTPSSGQYSTPEFVDKYTYMFAQDRKLRWLPSGRSAAACHDGEDYELVVLPAPATASAALQVRFDLLTAPTRRSCRRLCIADDCSPRLGPFNASGGRQLTVRYEYRSPVAAAESGAECVEHEYSGFTLRLLAPSLVQFNSFASPPSASLVSSFKQDWVLIIASAAGAAAILIVLVTAIAVLVVRWRRRRQSATPNMEMRVREINSESQKSFMAKNADAYDDDGERYAGVTFSEVGRRAASSRDCAAENMYMKLGMAADGGAMQQEEHVYNEFVGKCS